MSSRFQMINSAPSFWRAWIRWARIVLKQLAEFLNWFFADGLTEGEFHELFRNLSLEIR